MVPVSAQPRPKSARSLRRLIGIVAAYSLFVQSLFAGLVGAQFDASAAAGNGLPGFEICLTGIDGAPSTQGQPTGHSDGSSHCVLCVAGTHHVYAPPAVSAPAILAAAAGSVISPFDGWRVWAFPPYSSARPRGPPLSA
jgi:hypothetical protein